MVTTTRPQKVLFLLLAIIIASCQSKRVERKIIDAHFHARLYHDYGETPPPNPVTGEIPNWRTNEEVVYIMLATLKKNNVIKAICSGSLNRIQDFKTADPERIIPSLEYPDHQNNQLPDTTTFLHLIEEGKFSVFGELGLQYEGKTLTDSEFEPYLSICERMGIPIALHTGISAPNTPYECCPKFRTGLGNPQLIEEVLVKYPGLKVQFMHMGHPYLAETLAIMHVYPQVYVDIAVTNWILPLPEFYSSLKSLIDAGFGKRIMYGSDQMAWEDAIPLSIKNVENAPFLTEEQKEDIFYNNAVEFFSIK